MTLALRPLTIRLRVAYMATAYRAVLNQPFKEVSPQSSFDRLCDGGDHAYSRMWGAIGDFYEHQGLDKLCDAEIHDRFNAAMSIGFTARNKREVPATAVHAAAKLWEKRGWFRYEHHHAGRMKVAKRVAFFGLAIVGVPMISDL